MSEGAKNESTESSSTTGGQTPSSSSSTSEGASTTAAAAASSSTTVVQALQSPVGSTPIPAQFVFQQQIMSSPQQQQQLMSPQQQQPNTPGPSPGGQQQQNGGNVANSSPMNAMNMAAMSTINMSAMNQMMTGNAMAGMTMTGMGNPAASFQQSMGHAMQPMSSTSMPQVQVIQQPYGLPQLYSNAQGQQFFMPGNISLQPANQTIQVIAAGKPFQQGQLTPHLQITGKNMIQGVQGVHQNDQNAALLQFLNRSGGYATIPTSNNQTLIIGPYLNTQTGTFTQQQNVQQQQQQQQQQTKPNEMSKPQQLQPQQQPPQQQQQPFIQFVNGMPPKSPGLTSNNKGNNLANVGINASQANNMIPQPQIVTSQANSTAMQIGGQMHPMQIINPLQCSSMGQPFGQLPPGMTLATAGGQPTLLGSNSIYIQRPDGTFYPATQQQTIAAQTLTPQAPIPTAVKPRADTPKNGGTRPLTILPSSSGASTTPTPIRPASSAGSATSGSTPRPTGKAKKVGRPPQNQSRPVAPVQNQQTLLQPVQQQQLQQQQQQQQNQQMQAQQLIAQQFQMSHPFQMQYQQQQQPTLMPMQTFQQVQQVVQQSMDASQQAQFQQQINEQQQQQQQQLQFQMNNKPVMAVASSTAGQTSTCIPTSSSSSTPNNASSPIAVTSQSQPVQNAVASTQMTHQVIAQQQQTLMQLPASSSGPTYITPTTTTHTVRSNYKPIAPAPPQQPQQQQQQQSGLITMAAQPNNGCDNKSDQQPQILTIPVGQAVYGSIGVAGPQGIRPGAPMTTYQLPVSMGGDLQGAGGMVNLQLSSGQTSCYITSPPMTSMSRMALPAGMIMSTAPLSAMANMTPQTIASSSSCSNLQPFSTPGPRMSIPPMQPVTVTVPAVSSPQFALPSAPLTNNKPDDAKKEDKSSTTPKKSSETSEETKKEGPVSMSNGHHSPVAMRDRSKEPALPQAVVRPQILTHVLGDFVIQESSEPFPVGRFNTNDPLTRTNGHKIHENGNGKMDGEPPNKKLHMDPPSTVPTTCQPSSTPSNDTQQLSTPKGATMSTCEGCGKMDFITKSRRNKKFCSTACSKKAANNASSIEPLTSSPQLLPTAPVNGMMTVNNGLLTTAISNPLVVSMPPPSATPTNFSVNGDKEDTNLDAELMALAAQQMRSPSGSHSQTPTQQVKLDPKNNPAKWSVTEVVDFVRSLTGCADYADDFAMQEIDGQALMLLKADHLMSAMSMKLGPALKICAKIDAMRGAFESNSNGQSNGN